MRGTSDVEAKNHNDRLKNKIAGRLPPYQSKRLIHKLSATKAFNQGENAMSRSVIFKGQPFNLAGNELKVGSTAPDFQCVSSSLEVINLKQTSGKSRLFSVVPSLDTPVCSEQTKKFDQAVAELKDKVSCFTFSLDLPFAQKRFCTAEGIANMQSLSDTRDHSFGKNYGVLIEGLPMPLFSRAIFVLDKNDKVTYVEYVPEVGKHPDYDQALAALKQTAG